VQLLAGIVKHCLLVWRGVTSDCNGRRITILVGTWLSDVSNDSSHSAMQENNWEEYLNLSIGV